MKTLIFSTILSLIITIALIPFLWKFYKITIEAYDDMFYEIKEYLKSLK